MGLTRLKSRLKYESAKIRAALLSEGESVFLPFLASHIPLFLGPLPSLKSAIAFFPI